MIIIMIIITMVIITNYYDDHHYYRYRYTLMMMTFSRHDKGNIARRARRFPPTGNGTASSAVATRCFGMNLTSLSEIHRIQIGFL